MGIRALVVGVVCGALCLGVVRSGEARNLRRTLAQPVESQGGEGVQAIRDALEPLGAVIGAQIANQIPTLSTSAGYTYEFNPQLDVYERSTKTFGPLFSERAVTLGAKKFNVNASYSYIHFDTINGHDLHDITSRVEIAKDASGRRSFAGLRRQDLVNNFPGLKQLGPNGELIFTELNVDLDLEAQLVDFSMTYGLLDNLDVNVDIPVLRTFARSRVSERTLDPRFVHELGNFDTGEIRTLEPDVFSARESAIGIGDMRVRSKYLAVTTPVRLAGLLDLVLPTGSPGNFQGTGDTRLGTYLIASHTVAEIFEPHLQAGVEFNANDVNRSQAKYLAGVTAQVASIAALTVDFLGRSEFARLTEIPSAARLPAATGTGDNRQFLEFTKPFHGRPVLVNVNRNDILDLAVGGKISLGPQSIFFATAVIPLNTDGLRANVVPTVGFERTF
jgi:hypothetical protein